MKKKLITAITIGLSTIMLAACAQQTTTVTQPTATPDAMVMPDASISGQIDISDDAVTQSSGSAAPQKYNIEE